MLTDNGGKSNTPKTLNSLCVLFHLRTVEYFIIQVYRWSMLLIVINTKDASYIAKILRIATYRLHKADWPKFWQGNTTRQESTSFI